MRLHRACKSLGQESVETRSSISLSVTLRKVRERAAGIIKATLANALVKRK